MKKLLIVEDDEQLLFILSKFLENSGFKTLLAENGQKAVDILENDREIDLVIADLVMPVMDGVELCAYIRNKPELAHIPILILTGQSDIYNKSKSFNAGADDYLVKPVEFVEFMLRVKALLRRNGLAKAGSENKSSGSGGGVDIDRKNSTLKINGKDVYLTMTEFNIITYLEDKRQEPATSEELLEKILGYPPGTGNPVTIRTHIRNIRNKIEEDPNNPRILIIVPKRGYVLNTDI